MSDSDDCFGMFWELLKLCWYLAEIIVTAIVAIVHGIIKLIQGCIAERKEAKELAKENAMEMEEAGKAGGTQSAGTIAGETPEEVV